MQTKNYLFTLNNYKNTDITLIESLYPSKVSYLIYGKEIASTGTPHLQGFVTLNKKTTRSGVSNMFFPCKPHVESANGSVEDNRTYCSKDGDFREFGVVAKPGRRCDINAVREIVKAGGTFSDVMESCNSYQALKFAEIYIKNQPYERTNAPTVIWLWGSTGTGKSRLAHKLSSDPYVHSGTTFWNGYDGQTDVIFDDFDLEMFGYRNLLRILDRYKYMVNVKGSYVPFRAKQIIITCEFPPASLWNGNTFDQVMRRLKGVQCMDPYKNVLFEIRTASVQPKCKYFGHVTGS